MFGALLILLVVLGCAEEDGSYHPLYSDGRGGYYSDTSLPDTATSGDTVDSGAYASTVTEEETSTDQSAEVEDDASGDDVSGDLFAPEDRILLDLMHLTESDLSQFGRHILTAGPDFSLASDTPGFTVPADQAHGAAYLVGYLDARAEYRPAEQPRGIESWKFLFSYLSDGRFRPAVDGYADLRSYGTAQQGQFLDLAAKINSDRAVTSKVDQVLFRGGILPGYVRQAILIQELLDTLRLRHSVVLGLRGGAVDRDVLLFKAVRFAQTDFLFVYDPQKTYGLAEVSVILFDRVREVYNFEYYPELSGENAPATLEILSVLPAPEE